MDNQVRPDAEAFAEAALPRSVPSCLGAMWSRVLFPGIVVPSAPWRWLPLLLLLLLPGLLLYPCLSFYLFEPDEGRYAQIPREMLERGDWTVPYLQSEPYLDKPPLFYWLVMLSYRVLGVHDWSARLIPALSIHACILIAFLFGRRMLGDRAAFWGCVALMLAPAFLGLGRLLILDGLLAMLVTTSILAAWEASRGAQLRRGWWLLSALACGLGVLTKGPIAVLLLAPPLWLERRLSRRPAVGWRPILQYSGIVLLISLPWYVAVCLRLPEFAGYFLWEHNVVRFFMPFAHRQPVWYYLPVLLLGLGPAALLLVPWLRNLLSGDEQARHSRTPAVGFLLLTGGWCVLFFSLSDCKLPTYVLPAFPFLALAFGAFVANSAWADRPVTQVGAACAFTLMLIAHWVIVPRLAFARSPMNSSADLHALCGDPSVPVVCYPRPVDSVAFYCQRSDVRSFRSKDTPLLVRHLQENPRTVVLCGHRHSLEQLREVLPANLVMTHEAKLGLCDLAVVERQRRGWPGLWAANAK
jgi:4-amino-4-deoxy-L-arabinose transferase-like glycosyltransferase